MKARIAIALFCAACACAQQPQPLQSVTPTIRAVDPPDMEVVVEFDDGVKLTMAEFRQLVNSLPEEQRQGALQNRVPFLTQWGLMRRLARMAEQEKADQQSPLKDMLATNRTVILGTAEVQRITQGIRADGAEIIAYYDAHKEDYRMVRVKALRVAFNEKGLSGSTLTEEQAKAKAEKLQQQIKGGADFAALVKDNSDDAASRAKDGDFGLMSRRDSMDEALRTVIFSLTQGETSVPVRQGGGFYLLKATEVTYRPRAEVQDEIAQRVRDQKQLAWIQEINRLAQPKFPSAAFNSGGVSVPLQLPPPPK